MTISTDELRVQVVQTKYYKLMAELRRKIDQYHAEMADLFGKYDITNAIIGDRGLIEKVNVEMVALGLLLRNSRCDEISKVQDRGGNYMEKSPTLATKLQAYVYQLDNLAEI
jgi:hypothetical protein